MYRNYMVICPNITGEGEMTAGVQTELEELIRKAQAQPGITELMRAHGRYREVMEQTYTYVEGDKSFVDTKVSTRSD